MAKPPSRKGSPTRAPARPAKAPPTRRPPAGPSPGRRGSPATPQRSTVPGAK